LRTRAFVRQIHVFSSQIYRIRKLLESSTLGAVFSNLRGTALSLKITDFLIHAEILAMDRFTQNEIGVIPRSATTAGSYLRTLGQGAQDASRAEARLRFLNLRHLPFSGTFEEGGWILGINEEEVRILANAKHLPLLGRPEPNGKKKVCLPELAALGANVNWLNEAHEIIRTFWKQKNKNTQKRDNPKQKEKK